MSEQATAQAPKVNVLDRTLSVKLRLLEALAPEGTQIATDKDTVNSIIKTAESLDKTELSLRRLDIDQTNADNGKVVTEMMVETLKTLQNKCPFEMPAGVDAPPQGEIPPPPSADDLGNHTFVTGVQHIGIVDQKYDEFHERMMKENPPEEGLPDIDT